MKNIEEKKKKTKRWFRFLRNKICNAIQNIEKEHAKTCQKFVKVNWNRKKENSRDTGGGEMSILRGEIFEKAGVNISTVFGEIAKELKGKIPGTEKNKNFWASGISLVIHPKSPLIPAVHMNTRFIVTDRYWFGGGADITPSNKNSEDSINLAKIFHKDLENSCESYKKNSYLTFKRWCDEYFFLPHRNEPRGLGGVFYDYLKGPSWDKDFKFTKDIGNTFLKSYLKIIEKNINKTWTQKDIEKQNLTRSRYVEFNLLYDRGTKFGLMTNGNPDAIFMSLPPSASW